MHGYAFSIKKAAFFIIVSELCFTTMGASVKVLSENLPQETIVFFRNLFGLIALLPILHQQRTFRSLFKTDLIYLHIFRTVAGLTAMYCFFFSIEFLPLAQASLLKMTAPLFIPVLLLLFLGEKTGKIALLALPLGFFGVFIILNPQQQLSWPLMLGLLGGFLAAIAQIIVGRLSRRDSPVKIVLYFSLFSTAISAFPLIYGWQTPDFREGLILLLMGSVGAVGQILMSKGFSLAPTSEVASFTYFSILFSTLYGFLIWNETLDWHFFTGATLIIGGGCMIITQKKTRA